MVTKIWKIWTRESCGHDGSRNGNKIRWKKNWSTFFCCVVFLVMRRRATPPPPQSFLPPNLNILTGTVSFQIPYNRISSNIIGLMYFIIFLSPGFVRSSIHFPLFLHYSLGLTTLSRLFLFLSEYSTDVSNISKQKSIPIIHFLLFFFQFLALSPPVRSIWK